MHTRPRQHFTPARNWMNDPNGLIHHAGKYHLFYQYNPNGLAHTNISWGHATSTDLMTWTEHPVALPYDESEQVFSGSIVFDADNSSGLADDGSLVALYTSATPESQAQALAWSVDDGMTWEKYGVVLDRGTTDFRDPKVFRYRDHWILVAVEAIDRQILFYRSENLIDWTYLSTFENYGAREGIWECPDMFPVAGRWAVTLSVNPGHPTGGSGMQYFIGDFDGVRFKPESWDWLDWGTDYYAGVTYSGLTEPTMIGWLSNWVYAHQVPTEPWRGGMALPRRVSLREGRLAQEPAVEAVRPPYFELYDTCLNSTPLRLDQSVMRTTTRVQIKLQTANDSVTIVLRNAGSRAAVVKLVCSQAELRLEREASEAVQQPGFDAIAKAPLPEGNAGALDLDIWLDANSMEIFALGGTITMSMLTLADPGECVIEIVSQTRTAILEHLMLTDPTQTT